MKLHGVTFLFRVIFEEKFTFFAFTTTQSIYIALTTLKSENFTTA